MQVYFDNAATTPVHPLVFEKMKPFLTGDFGNPSSSHSFGRKTRVAIEDARETIAWIINANPGEIYFTSGGTEANNFSIRGIVEEEFHESGRKKIITSNSEHHCVLDVFEMLGKNGFESKFIKIDNTSSPDLNELSALIGESVSFVSNIHVNNETGTINPIEKISGIVNNKTTYLHTDAVQSFGKLKIDVKKLGVSSLCASSHKINGPKGAGFSFIKSGTPVHPLIIGGSQERNRRGGTENVAAIIGFAEAAKIAVKEIDENYSHTKKLRSSFTDGIKSIAGDRIRINGGDYTLPNILSFSFISDFFNNDAESMLMFLDINGIAASNGAACTSGTWKPSHVIINSGYSKEDASGTIRFSFGKQNTFEEIEYSLEILSKMVKKFEKK